MYFWTSPSISPTVSGLPALFEGILLTVSPLAIKRTHRTFSQICRNLALKRRWAAAFPFLIAYRPISALLTSVKCVCTLHFLAFYWLACFSNARLTLVRFASCHRSDCSVFVTGKCRSKILPNIHLGIAAAIEV